jgi:hypothetical protein
MSRRLASLFALTLALLPACKGDEPGPDGGKGPDTKVAADEGLTAGDAGDAGANSAAEPAASEATAGPAEGGPAGEDADADTDADADEGALEPVPETFEKVGVATCDDYVAAYERCIAEKVPEGEREAQRRVVFDNVAVWQQTAKGGPAGEKGLQTACKIATEQAKRSTEAWGCAW